MRRRYGEDRMRRAREKERRRHGEKDNKELSTRSHTEPNSLLLVTSLPAWLLAHAALNALTRSGGEKWLVAPRLNFMVALTAAYHYSAHDFI